MKQEMWKPVQGYGLLYEVSNIGNVKSLQRPVWNGHQLVIKPEIVLKPNTLKKGYFQVTLYNGRERKSFQVHRLVAQAFIQNPLGYGQVNHINGNKQDNRVENLEWCDNSMNQLHAYKMGLNKPHPSGKQMIPVVAIKGDERLKFKCIADCNRYLKTSWARDAMARGVLINGYKIIRQNG